ncbi:hypothetical protein BDZ94DRAFT_1366125 [Collybia nuda]|uniref:JmjC domain-containing protein n=1 Tax=Collybia nuda TaxID=64659 RepID=A0A9P5Y7A2_9AGAR|nr:hypothetical protein BDZ94DRAFT_1366125 [Collybia nuda]
MIKCSSNLPEEQFMKIWSYGLPLLIVDVWHNFQLSWTPQYFINKQGRKWCMVEDTSSGIGRKAHVADFFSLFGQCDPTKPVKRLKDWPPTAEFKTVFPDLYDDFMAFVPMKDYTMARGSLNLASNFPKNMVYPDLGPKMYIALEDQTKTGSTRLHLDLSDAVNILVHEGQSSTGESGALWHIFSQEDTVLLGELFKNHYSYSGTGNPIHQHTIYLTSSDLDTLKETHSITPYEIIQHYG